APYLTRLNEIRAAHPALRDLQNLTLHRSTHQDLLVFSKTRTARPEGEHRDAEAVTDAGAHEDTVITVVTVNPHHVAEATLDLDLSALRLRPEDLDESGSFEVEDLLTGQRWRWGRTPYVRLDPHVEPAHVLRVVRHG
ncbi:alpha-1,4-glucan--maltose-1-phosphate maltosyltransferase, partial [Micrococcus endophyticus]